MRYFWIMNSRREDDLETIRELRDEVESLQDALGDADKKIDNLIEENKKLAGKIKR